MGHVKDHDRRVCLLLLIGLHNPIGIPLDYLPNSFNSSTQDSSTMVVMAVEFHILAAHGKAQSREFFRT